ncbi:hypothetical protein Y590_25440 (plasmid) [Methylobacterium sp. AMS5]|nr:hypothetical protein Y590_25440 [Methylobacterium sp. AMS5]
MRDYLGVDRTVNRPALLASGYPSLQRRIRDQLVLRTRFHFTRMLMRGLNHIIGYSFS